MTRKSIIALTTLLGLLSVVNGFMLFLNTSVPSRAAIAGMNYQELIRDSDFTRAVKSVVQECKVNIDIAKLMC
ncbi:MAG TPA: hypothetical protein VH684_09015 [Xanthobacteraceae bacterium]|jgi:hypothetical protein